MEEMGPFQKAVRLTEWREESKGLVIHIFLTHMPSPLFQSLLGSRTLITHFIWCALKLQSQRFLFGQAIRNYPILIKILLEKSTHRTVNRV